MDGSNALGEFLRARRALVRPEDVGLPGGGLRRVPGLRREEVAMLSGISSDYYLRLEQGRDRNPSVQVLEAVARVLRLDADATAHLVGLARERPASGARPGRRTPQVPASLLQLIDGWPRTPAYLQNRYTDCLAANALATAITPNYRPGVNLLRAVFLDPAERALRRDWEDLTAEGVAALRSGAGADADDPRLRDLVGELSLRSERFRVLWARHEVRPRRGRVSRLTHPQVGDLDLHSDKLSVEGADGLTLVVFHAEPGSRSAELLDILGSLSAPAAGSAQERVDGQ
ncbi:Helix-turn-helix domain-containing protein [Streptomyces sp. 1222.5]|uniref:helix-turn-helix domain-containing protein n=1 Tax=unclassified Streptomyces TaxID=2593676 RepID=UPI00089CD12A|nr:MULTISPECIES: helix-turn-helix transcriptional regulator [unclassified Streptomyces]PKW05798.1 helix-turn-helix protein [Streptomyces sp. 5112.2]SED28367.1 Helix-turn-helix domain-containing protein [Streptomyces sp. 1222.5]